jgi:hypothetical protein
MHLLPALLRSTFTPLSSNLLALVLLAFRPPLKMLQQISKTMAKILLASSQRPLFEATTHAFTNM